MNVLQRTRNERNPCLKQNRPDRSYRDNLLKSLVTLTFNSPVDDRYCKFYLKKQYARRQSPSFSYIFSQHLTLRAPSNRLNTPYVKQLSKITIRKLNSCRSQMEVRL